MGVRRGERPRVGGFTTLELLITLVVFSILVVLSIPLYRSYVNSHRLRGSVENLASQVRLARERAMTLGVDQPLHLYENTYDADFHVHVPGVVSYRWNLPAGVHYATGTTNVFVMRRDGTSSTSGWVVLRDDNGRRDTLSVLSTGLVLVR